MKKGLLKWPLTVVVLILASVNYHALTEIIFDHLLDPLSYFVDNHGYSLDIKGQVRFVVTIILPGVTIIDFVTDISKKNLKEKASTLYNRASVTQLIILAILLPILLYLQNQFLNLWNSIWKAGPSNAT